MEGYQPKKKIGMLHPKYKKVKLPKGGFGLEKVNKKDTECKYGKLSNGGTLVKPCDSPTPPPPPPSQLMIKFKNGSEIHSIDCNDGIRRQGANNLCTNNEIQCHSCSNKDICKYQGDYLEQVVHIIDVYDGVFDLNCNHYRTIEALHIRYNDEVLYEKMTLDIYDQHRKIIQNGLK